jgi:orotate phosphoribosyltransferase-like protein
MWHRPTVYDHYQSFAVVQTLPPDAEILLVDDVVTKGRTLVAGAMRLREAFPQAQIRAFALLRTKGFVDEIERVIDPCVGEIHWNGTDAFRDP